MWKPSITFTTEEIAFYIVFDSHLPFSVHIFLGLHFLLFVSQVVVSILLDLNGTYDMHGEVNRRRRSTFRWVVSVLSADRKGMIKKLGE